jgi:hypothetical protein
MAETVTLTLVTGESRLSLPVRLRDDADDSLAEFAPAEAADSSSTQRMLEPASFRRSIEHDLVNNELIYRLISEGGDLDSGAIVRIEEIDLELGHIVERIFRIDEQNPLSASSEISERIMIRRQDWEIQVIAQTNLKSDKKYFRLSASLRAELDGVEIFKRKWNEQIERDLI